MASSHSATFPEVWDKAYQMEFDNINVARQVADTSKEKLLTVGDTLHRQYGSQLVAQTVTRGTDMTVSDLTDTDESMTIDYEKGIIFPVHNFDKTQSNLDIAAHYGKRAAQAMSEEIDAVVLGAVFNADTTLDAGDFGGTAGNGISVTTSNVAELFSKSTKSLGKLNVPESDRVAIISYDLEEVMSNLVTGRETVQGDAKLLGMNKFMGFFNGYKIFKSNQTATSARWTPADQPTTGATITIEGVTWQLVTSIGTAAGNVLVETDTATTLDNLVDAINNPSVTNDKHIAIANTQPTFAQDKVATRFTAVDGTTYLDVKVKGAGTITVASSEAADVWSREKQHLILGNKGFTTLVEQYKTSNKIKDNPLQDGVRIMSTMIFGEKSFADQDRTMVNVEVDSSSF